MPLVQRRRAVRNAKKRGKIDPSRTATLRRTLTMEMRRRFSALKARIRKLLLEEDAFGLAHMSVANTNPEGCNQHTGPGCGGGDAKLESAKAWVNDRTLWKDRPRGPVNVDTQDTKVPFAALTTDPNIKDNLFPETVGKYVEQIKDDLKNNVPLRPLVVTPTGEGKYTIQDGNHYYTALKQVDATADVRVLLVTPKEGYRFDVQKVFDSEYWALQQNQHMSVANANPEGCNQHTGPGCGEGDGGSAATPRDFAAKAAEQFNREVNSIHRTVHAGALTTEESQLTEAADKYVSRVRGTAGRAWREVEAKVLEKHGDTAAVRSLLDKKKADVSEALATVQEVAYERATDLSEVGREDRESSRADVSRAAGRVHDEIASVASYVERYAQSEARSIEWGDAQQLAQAVRKEGMTPKNKEHLERLGLPGRYVSVSQDKDGVLQIRSPADPGGHFRAIEGGMQLFDDETNQPTGPGALREKMKGKTSNTFAWWIESVHNRFCPTGPGGGVDPTCGADTPAGADTKVDGEGDGKGTFAEKAVMALGAGVHKVEQKAVDLATSLAEKVGLGGGEGPSFKQRVIDNYQKLPEPVRDIVSAGVQTAFVGWTVSQALAERIAKEQGLSDKDAATLRSTLAVTDIAAFKPAAVVAGALGPVATTLSWVVPPVTGAYLLTSAATSPIKTLKAAYGMVKDAAKWTKEKVHGPGGFVTSNATKHQLVADALASRNYSDWWFALFTAACALTADVDKALELADRVYTQHPTQYLVGNEDGEPVYTTEWNGLTIDIETLMGEMRVGSELAADYGYVRGVMGADGDSVDVFLGPDLDAENVYVVSAVNAGGEFDEHKCMIGFASQEAAVRAYQLSYPPYWKMGEVEALTVDQFKAWLEVTENIFCPTGEGGGVDSSCGGTGEGGGVRLTQEMSYGRKELLSTFTVDGKTFMFTAGQVTDEDTDQVTDEWHISFGLRTPKGFMSTTMTNDPSVSAIKVLTEVGKRLDAVIRQVQPPKISFTAALHEPSKVKAYETLAKRIGKAYGYDVKSRSSWDNFREYTLTKKPTTNAGQFKAWLRTTNSNPEGCNQHTGPGCGATSEVKEESRTKASAYDSGPGDVVFHRISLVVDGKKVGSTQLMHHEGGDPKQNGGIDPDTGYMADLTVLEDERGKGYGHELYRQVVEQAKKLGLKRIASDNARKPATDKIWQKLGATHDKATARWYLTLNVTTNAGQFSFGSSPQKLAAFQRWLKSHVQTYIAGESERVLWEKYARAGWRKGSGRAYDDYSIKAKLRDPDYATKNLPYYKGSKDEFLRSSFSAPESVEKIQLLASRSFTDLENVTSDMSARMSRTLTDGLTQGMNPREIAGELADDIDISAERAEMIARTEIIRAHAEGQLDSFERLGVTEIGVEVEWSTAGDDRVCEECSSMEGDIYTVEDAHGLIPAHPNCRCSFLPVIPTFEEPTENRRRVRRAPTINWCNQYGGDTCRDGGAEGEGFKTGYSISIDRPHLVGEEVKEYNTLFREQKGLYKSIKAGTATDAEKERSTAVKARLNELSKIAKERRLGKGDPPPPPPPPVVPPKVEPPKVEPPVKDEVIEVAKLAHGEKYTPEQAAAYAKGVREKMLASHAAKQAEIDTVTTEVSRLGKQASADAMKGNYSTYDAYKAAGNKLHQLRESVRSEAHKALELPENERAQFDTPGVPRSKKDLTLLKESRKKGEEFLSKIIAKGDVEKFTGKYKVLGVNGRAFHRAQFNHNAKEGENRRYSIVAVAPANGAGTVVHEWGHAMEWQDEGIGRQAQDFLKRRTEGEEAKPMSELGRGYRRDEMGRDDDFAKTFGKAHGRYVGKDYSGRASEIMSMGLEKLYQDPVGFAKVDPDYFDFVVSVAHGRRR